MSQPPRIAFYGDDFTGSTDTLMACATGGLKSLLFVRPPDAAALARAGHLDVVGLAGHARSLTPPEMDIALPKALGCLAATGAPVLHYKTCSTFDSAPHIGSIGHAVRLGRRHVTHPFVPIVGGQPNLGRYCAFANLFAVDRHGGTVSRIDRHPTMSCHPVTPMLEADMRRHLAQQGLAAVASFDLVSLEKDAGAHDRELETLLARAPNAVLFDVTAERHLSAIGRLIWERACRAQLLAVGPTSVAQALMAHWRQSGELPSAAPVGVLRRAPEQVVVISGSRSPVTARQIAHARAEGFAMVELDARALAENPAPDGDVVKRLVQQIVDLLPDGRSVIARLSDDLLADGARGARVGIVLARACGSILSGVLAHVPLRRVAVAGGDSSSYAVQGLGIDALAFATAIGPGSALCRTHAQAPRLDGLEILLKGGQMGRDTVFTDLRDGVNA